MVPPSPGLKLPFLLILTVATSQAIPLPQDDENSSNLLELTNDDAFNIIQDSLDQENDPNFPLPENSMGGVYPLTDMTKSQDMKRKFSAWAGKRTAESDIPWGSLLRNDRFTSGVIRRAFNPWAGKRAFQPWAGKRSGDGVERRRFNPWAGKRSDDLTAVASDKRGFKPWAGKRSDVPYDVDTQGNLEAQVADFMEKRSSAFSPWKGKRSRPSGKRVFNPWAGK